MIKPYLLLGRHIGYSLSPLVHRAINDYFNIDASYRLYDSDLPMDAIIDHMQSNGIAGFNVTIPYKQTIINQLDALSDVAINMQSVNTVTRREGRWYGDNTDSLGFGLTLDLNAIDLTDKTVLVLGAGGAARAIVDQLITRRVKMILIYNRTRARTNRLMLDVRARYQWFNVMSVFDYHGLVVNAVINATPLGDVHHAGTPPLDLDFMKTDTYIDLVYRPSDTVALRQARNKGLTALGGLDMLICQALYSAKIWHGIEADLADVQALITRVKADVSDGGDVRFE